MKSFFNRDKFVWAIVDGKKQKFYDPDIVKGWPALTKQFGPMPNIRTEQDGSCYLVAPPGMNDVCFSKPRTNAQGTPILNNLFTLKEMWTNYTFLFRL